MTVFILFLSYTKSTQNMAIRDKTEQHSSQKNYPCICRV